VPSDELTVAGTIGTNLLEISDYGYALGGFHVGDIGDPGTDNLIVDGQTDLRGNVVDTTGDITINDALDITSTNPLRFAGWWFANHSSSYGGANGVFEIGPTQDIDINFKPGIDSKLYIDADLDRVGVGTTVPEGILHIKSAQPYVYIEESTLGNKYFLRARNDGGFDIYDATSGDEILYYTVGNNLSFSDDKFYIKSDGNVGIGTTSPESGLHIKGAYPTGYFIVERTGVNGGGDAGTAHWQTDGKTIGDGTIFSLAMRNSADESIAYGQIRAKIVDPTDGSEDSNLRFFNYKAGANTEAMTILNSGNVGIGVTSPNYKLEVASGNVYLQDTTYLGTTSYYVDSSGNAKFLDLIAADTGNPGLTVGNGSTGYLKIGGSTISDAAGDLTLDSDSGVINANDIIETQITDSYDKIRVYPGSPYTIGMKSAQTYGGLNDWAMTFTMNNDADRGWLWRDESDAVSDGAMSLTTAGGLKVKGNVTTITPTISAHAATKGYVDGITDDYIGEPTPNPHIAGAPLSMGNKSITDILLLSVNTNAIITNDLRADNFLVDVASPLNDAALTMNDASRYVWTPANGWGVYWNTSDNTVEYYGGGTERGYIDLDNGQFQMDGTGYFNGSLYTGDLYLGYDDASATLTTYDTNETLTIDPNGTGNIILQGNVGIGTSSPKEELDVFGTIQVGEGSNAEVLIGHDKGGGGESGLIDPSNDKSIAVKLDDGSGYQYGAMTGASNGIFINSSGNVGIGKINPSYELDVAGAIASNGVAIAHYNGSTFRLGDVDGEAADVIIVGDAGSIFLEADNGNVGIGTTVPQAKLHVWNGQAMTSNGTGGYLAPIADQHLTPKKYVDEQVAAGGADGYLPDDPADSDVNMNNHLILNIGNAATDFTSGGGLTLAGTFDPNGSITLPTTGITGAGPNSGLNADLLDSISSGSFIRSDTTDYFTSTIYFRGDLVGGDNGYRDHGVYGNYDSYKTDHIWSMGTAYRNAADGSNFGNLYGLAYKHTNNTTGGTMAGGHQMVWAQNGTGTSAMGSGLWTSGAIAGASLTVTGKVTASEMDPPYSIDGVIYATYGHSTTGLKEETTGKVELGTRVLGCSGKQDLYYYIINFDEAEKESDLWLFKEITAFGDEWNDLVVTLTPEGKADVWYEFIPKENKLIIYGNQPVKVSYRLMAPRFDWPERDTNLYDGTGKASEGIGIFIR